MAESTHALARSWPLFCDRCSTELTSGKGNFYVVKIEAIADPSPPMIDEKDLRQDLRRDIEQLIEEMSDLSKQRIDGPGLSATDHFSLPSLLHEVDRKSERMKTQPEVRESGLANGQRLPLFGGEYQRLDAGPCALKFGAPV
jgi:hypothetical protein